LTGGGTEGVAASRLGPEHNGAIAELCRRALGADAPGAADLGQALFSDRSGPPAVVRGHPEMGVVASVRRRGNGYIRLLAVHPEHRRRGLGTALMAAAEADLSGCDHVTVGADAPDYLFPGVSTRLTEMLCLMEALGYSRREPNLNLSVDLDNLAPDPGGAVPSTGHEREEIEAWMTANWPDWRDEVMRAHDRGTLLITRDSQGLAGFCAWDVNRSGWLGPIAVRRAAIGAGKGVPLLLGALHRMRATGRRRAEIAWISPVRFYVRNVSAVVGDVFVVHRKRMP
jgi:mycothiol synthase